MKTMGQRLITRINRLLDTDQSQGSQARGRRAADAALSYLGENPEAAIKIGIIGNALVLPYTAPACVMLEQMRRKGHLNSPRELASVFRQEVMPQVVRSSPRDVEVTHINNHPTIPTTQTVFNIGPAARKG